MPDRNEAEIVYYRAKSDASGALAVGCILLAFALLVLTQDSIAGIGFSKDLVVMSTYLALPLGVVLILANIRHIMAKGPTMVAMKDGITVLFTDQRVGPLHWTAITGFKAFRHQGKYHLGITFENPKQVLYPYKDYISDLVKRKGPKTAHLKIDGKMLDDDMDAIVSDLEEMRQLFSWRAR
jgi:hypothetical protein